jgi:hypothetical protein
MRKIIKIKLGEPVPTNYKLVKIEKHKENLTAQELYQIRWSGFGKLPFKEIEYCYYEVNQ